MSMPNRLVFVRHGQSEPNLIHQSERDANGESSDLHFAHNEVYERHDWEQRLTKKGVDQAKVAGDWITKNIMNVEDFDRRYVSTFQRAFETAYNISSGTDWLVEDRVRERDWGEFGATPYEERKMLFPYTFNASKTNSFYANLNGGESLSDVQMRVRDFVGTLHRDMPGKNVLVVSHGELITVARYLIERMLPEEIVEADKDKTQSMKNCTILEYTRVDPEDSGMVSDHISWMRMVYPYAEDESPFGGKWNKITEKRVFSGADLLRRLELTPALTRSN